MKTFSPSEFDLQLIRLATSHSNSVSASARQMIRGKAQRLIWQWYKTENNREMVWREWQKLAGVQ